MAVCKTCQRMIQKLHPHDDCQRTKLVSILPLHNSRTCRDCWVCLKFSDWLREEKPEVYQSWKSSPLPVIFQRGGYDANSSSETSPGCLENAFFQFKIYPAPSDDELDSCALECFFIPKESSSYPNKLFIITEMCNNVLTLVEFNKLSKIEVPLLDSLENLPFNAPLTKAWIDRCTTSGNHAHCNRIATGTWYPTRLILLEQNGQSMRLVLSKTHKPTGPYVTLSHRWGPTNYDTLTSATIDGFQQSINVPTLPQVFQDAGILASSIGINYIWIDALCIMQDANLVDWKIEAPRMRKVYSHSFLTISATFSDDGTGSLFSQDKSHPFQPIPFHANIVHVKRRFVVGNPKAKRFRVTLRPREYYMLDGNIWNFEIEQAPLQSRGWVFQERVLSTRILHLGKRQLAWECKETSALEILPNMLPAGLVETSKSEIIGQALSSKAFEESQESFQDAWSWLVTQYSKCHLTKKEDKLIALSGIAQLIGESREDQYMCGLWKSTFISDLAWTRLYDDEQKKPSPAETSFRAPSWSWLSLDGEIYFPPAESSVLQFAKIISYPESSMVGVSVLRARGTIDLEGVLIPLESIQWSGDAMDSFTVAGLEFEDGSTSDESHLDIEGETKHDVTQVCAQGVHILPLFQTQRKMFAMAVTQGQNKEYKRVGAAQFQLLNKDILPRHAQKGWKRGYLRIPGHKRRVPYDINLAALELRRQILAGEKTIVNLV